MVQPLQSISMAEERQGEAHADGLAKLSSMQANAALQQALTLADSTNAAVYGSIFAQAPALPQPANGLAALQVLHCWKTETIRPACMPFMHMPVAAAPNLTNTQHEQITMTRNSPMK